MKLNRSLLTVVVISVLIELYNCQSVNNPVWNAVTSNPIQCPPHYVLVNNMCYLPDEAPTIICPTGYQPYGNLCYPIEQKPCPAGTLPPTVVEPSTLSPPIITNDTTTTTTEMPVIPTTTTTTTTTTEMPAIPIPETTTTTTTEMPVTPIPETTTTTTTEMPVIPTTTTTTTTTTTEMPVIPIPETTTTTTTEVPIIPTPLAPPEIARCPLGSVLQNGECRKIICPNGELYGGICIKVQCPKNLVWRGGYCQPPRYLTTILEIDNVFVNDARLQHGEVNRLNVNNIEYHTLQTDDNDEIQLTPVPPTTPPSITVRPTATNRPPAEIIKPGCCVIVSPRICKQYGQKWICFHQRSKRCDVDLCKNPVIYLKTPKVVYEPPVLIMPPNPPLTACRKPNCDATETVDCSGCPHNRREQCSPHCYSYICPENACSYVELYDYCQAYPGEFGCKKSDGCIWGWCGETPPSE